jgi:hypothetical protein
MVVKNQLERSRAVQGGIVAGIVGGIALAVYLLLMAAFSGADAWPALKGASAPFMGERAFDPGFDLGAVILGVVLHFLVSIGWGVLFAVFAYGLGRGQTLAAGLGFGIVVWLVMFYLILPLFGMAEVTASVPIASAIFEHLLFGFFVAVAFLPYQPLVPAAPSGRQHPLPH